ncbi:MAG: TatD DNase family protein [Parcubacteria bacterium C7867-007]|nr:MAG: TatD DNase family protein [Parcubacteria bacterium C7867-007]
MKYFDAHCHIQFDAYDADREELVRSMDEQGVGGLVVGVDRVSSEQAIKLVEKHESLFAAVGLHPNDCPEEVFTVSLYRELASHPKVLAIGECGLDNYRPEDPEATKRKQREVFEQHVQLAIETDKPLMIHSRPSKGTQDAYEDTIDILKSYKREHGDKVRGDMHFFVGGVEEARQFVDLDFTLSYTAVLTFTQDYDEVVRFAPLTHLLSETDSPYVAPAPNRGKRNDPRAVQAVIGAIARIRGEDEEMVRDQVLQNAERLFGATLRGLK